MVGKHLWTTGHISGLLIKPLHMLTCALLAPYITLTGGMHAAADFNVLDAALHASLRDSMYMHCGQPCVLCASEEEHS